MKTLFLLLIVLLLSSCEKSTLPPKEIHNEPSRIINSSTDVVLTRVYDWCSRHGANVQFVDTSGGVIHAEFPIEVSALYKYTDYVPQTGVVDPSDVVCSFYCEFRPEQNGTKTTIKAVFKGKVNEPKMLLKGQYSERDTKEFKTTGMIEKEILDFLSTPE